MKVGQEYLLSYIDCFFFFRERIKCEEIYGFDKNYITDVTISYEVNGKKYEKDFDLSGTYSFKPGETCYCYVHTQNPKYVRLDLKPGCGPEIAYTASCLYFKTE